MDISCEITQSPNQMHLPFHSDLSLQTQRCRTSSKFKPGPYTSISSTIPVRLDFPPLFPSSLSVPSSSPSLPIPFFSPQFFVPHMQCNVSHFSIHPSTLIFMPIYRVIYPVTCLGATCALQFPLPPLSHVCVSMYIDVMHGLGVTEPGIPHQASRNGIQ